MIKTSCFSSRGAKIYKKVPLSTNKQIKGPFSRTTITIILSFFLSLFVVYATSPAVLVEPLPDVS